MGKAVAKTRSAYAAERVHGIIVSRYNAGISSHQLSVDLGINKQLIDAEIIKGIQAGEISQVLPGFKLPIAGRTPAPKKAAPKAVRARKRA